MVDGRCEEFFIERIRRIAYIYYGQKLYKKLIVVYCPVP